MVSISPSSLRNVIASRTGVRLAPNRAPVSASDTMVPGGSDMERMADFSAAWICCAVG
jgi:hypothetical protein